MCAFAPVFSVGLLRGTPFAFRQSHPECPQRLDAIEDRLLVSGVGDALERREAPTAPLADIELAHGRMFMASLRGLFDLTPGEVARECERLLAADHVDVTRERKGKSVTDDIRPYIHHLEVVDGVVLAELGTQPRGLRPGA